MRLSQAYQSMGHYTEAFQSLKAALALAEQAQDPARLAVVLESAGNLYLAAGQDRGGGSVFAKSLKHCQGPQKRLPLGHDSEQSWHPPDVSEELP